MVLTTARKLKTFLAYNMAEAKYIIDYLLELPKDSIKNIADGSLYMDEEGHICSEAIMPLDEAQHWEHALRDSEVGTGKQHEEKQNTSLIGTEEVPAITQTISREDSQREGPSDLEIRVTTRKQAKAQQQLPLHWEPRTNIDSPGLPEIVQGEHITMNNYEHTQPAQTTREQLIDAEEDPAIAPDMRNLVNMDTFHEVYMKEEDLLEKADPRIRPETRESFLRFCQELSPYMKYADLAQSQNDDPFLGRIRTKCQSNKTNDHQENDRVKYFIQGDQDILGREIVSTNGQLIRYQLCIPAIHAHDFILKLHRSLSEAGAISVAGTANHYGPRKLAKFVAARYHINKLARICQLITNACQICREVKVHHITRPDYEKCTVTVARPGQAYYADVLQISSVANEWNFTSVLTFADMYSNFAIMLPILENMTQEYFIRLFHTGIIGYFGRPEIIYTDNDSRLSGGLVKSVSTILSIAHGTTSRYSPRSSAAESVHRHILAAMRVQRESYAIPLRGWQYTLTAALNAYNFGPYQDGDGYMSPATLFWGPQAAMNHPDLNGDIPYIQELFDDRDETLKIITRTNYIMADLRKHLKEKRDKV